RAQQLGFDDVLAPAAAERGGAHRLRGVAEFGGGVEGGAQGGAGVAGGGLDPDTLERALGVEAGVGDAVEGDPAGEGEVGRAGAPVDPAGEVQEDVFEAALHARGEVGVRGGRLPAGFALRHEAVPVDRFGAEAAVVGGVYGL